MLKRCCCGGVQSLVAIVLAALLAAPAQAQAPLQPQAPPAPAPAGAPQTLNPAPVLPDSLRIIVLEGQGESHDIRDRVASSPVVEVRDENNLPVEAADVVFELPAVGPSGTFADQQTKASTKTNFQGQATVTFMPNLETGRFNIKVTASQGNRVGHATITQVNALRAGKVEAQRGGILAFRWWKVAVIAGAGAAIGYFATRGGGSGQSVTLIPGTPTFGAP